MNEPIETYTKPVTLDIPVDEYSRRREISMDYTYIVLHEKYIEYRVKGFYQYKDEDKEIWEDKDVESRCIKLREDLCMVEFYHKNGEDEGWHLVLDWKGSESDEWKFKDEQLCKGHYKQLKQYMINR